MPLHNFYKYHIINNVRQTLTILTWQKTQAALFIVDCMLGAINSFNLPFFFFHSLETKTTIKFLAQVYKTFIAE